MLPKQYRLVHEKEIRASLRSRHHYSTKHLRLWMSSHNDPQFKLLIIISKKVYKKANKRFRCKRKIHAIFETLQASNRLPPHTRCIVQVTHKHIIHQNHNELKEEIIPALTKLYSRLTNSV